MKWQTLDSIVRSVLLQRGYPMHWYVDFLKFASDGLRELHFDTMKCITSVKLPVNEYKAVALPCDYVDLLRVGTEAGQYVKPMTQEANMNRLNNFDDLGNKVPFGNVDSLASGILNNVIPTFTTLNALGEFTGGVFNHRAGTAGLNYVEIRERNEIQLDNAFEGDYVVLDYITDGLSGDAATQVHPYAQAAIEAYVIWKMKSHNRTYTNEVAQAEAAFDKQHSKLRGRMSEMTLDDIKHASRKGYSGTYKN